VKPELETLSSRGTRSTHSVGSGLHLCLTWSTRSSARL